MTAGVDIVCVGCEAAMKSDEDFIAGIYQKAEERKKEERAAEHDRYFRVWQTLAAAACLCLIVFGVTYANSRKETPKEDNVSENNAVMALSLDESGMPGIEKADTYRAAAQRKSREGQQEESAVLNGFWTGYEFAYSMAEQISSAKDNTETQEAGGN